MEFITHGVHYLHRPGLILQDAGFFLLPELGQDKSYLSESFFAIIFFSFILWTFHPFVFQSKKIYTVLIWCRVFAYLVVCQFLRIITFYSTQLPGPNYHCREANFIEILCFACYLEIQLSLSGLRTCQAAPSEEEVLLLNFSEGVMYGCGDLIFSSHMIFTLVFVRTFQKYGTRFIKRFAWFVAIVQSLLIIASRKHYTVDVVVACNFGGSSCSFPCKYTVNLVVSFVDQNLPELPDQSMGSTSPPLLPTSTEDRDS